ncbi:MAG TPA: hypothetical protein VN920_13130 [Pyrinomonadaceae bacterium]|nr:hypothetical protein [Pyrinomonadaceae bacterium]
MRKPDFLPHFLMLLFAAPLVLLLSLSAFAQNNSKAPSAAADQKDDQKSEQLINRAIEVYGGAAYLNVHTAIGRGFYTLFRDGVPQLPAKFVDYIVYPDKERTEFTGGGTHLIQTNFGSEGWNFDGATKTIKDQKPEQIEDFKFAVKTSIDYLLRGNWRKEGAKLSYVGRREAGLAKRNETIRLEYPDGFWIEYEFGARDGLPAKIIYMRKRKNADTGVIEEYNEEDRLQKPITIDGVTSAWVIDHFINTKQFSRIAYESVEYNKPVADSLFTKPTTVKGMK